MQDVPGKKAKITSLSSFIILSFIFLVLGTGIACSKLILFPQIAEVKNDPNIKFVHFSDVHYDPKSKDRGQRLYGHSRELIIDAFNQVNAVDNIELAVFTGDSINRPSKQDFTKFLQLTNELKAPWYLSTGNHEIGIGGGLSKKERVNLINHYKQSSLSSQAVNKPDKSGSKIDKSYYSFVPKRGYLFIAMDGVVDNRITNNGYFSPKELNWLDKQLTDNPDSKAVIFQHFPIIEPFESSSHRIINADEYMNILRKHKNVVAVLSGHYHTNKVIKSNNIAFICSPALVEYPNAFRVITITDKNGKIYLKSEFKETGLKNIRQYSKEKSRSWQLHEGQPEDKTIEVVLDKQR